MIIGCIGIICFFMSMINIMDDIFKKSKEYLIHWKHFWISMSVLGSLIRTTTMKEIAVAEATSIQETQAKEHAEQQETAPWWEKDWIGAIPGVK